MKISEVVFRRFAAIYTAKWTSTAKQPGMLDELLLVWGQELAGLTDRQIDTGLAKLRKHPAWPPTPFEFRALCMPDAEELGLPDVEQAYRIATGNVRTGETIPPIVRCALRTMGTYELRTLPRTAMFRPFAIVYEALRQEAIFQGFGVSGEDSDRDLSLRPRTAPVRDDPGQGVWGSSAPERKRL